MLSALSFTNHYRPSFKDRLWEVWQMVKAWNNHIKENFYLSWVSCLDESTSIWLTKFTCPGWVFCPQKPNPYGNEYHTICCGKSGIMYAAEMVEGKDRPKERPVDPTTTEHGRTGGLLLCLTRSLVGRGCVVILDSGFCVLKALVALKKVGIFASALIKKRSC